MGKVFFGQDSTGNKNKDRKMGLNQTRTFLHSKGNNKQSEDAMYRCERVLSNYVQM
jgi:hypothetical protein